MHNTRPQNRRKKLSILHGLFHFGKQVKAIPLFQKAVDYSGQSFYGGVVTAGVMQKHHYTVFVLCTAENILCNLPCGDIFVYTVLAVGVPIVPDKSAAGHFVFYFGNRGFIRMAVCASAGKAKNSAAFPGYGVYPILFGAQIRKKAVNPGIYFVIFMAITVQADFVSFFNYAQKTLVGKFPLRAYYKKSGVNALFRKNIKNFVGTGRRPVVKRQINAFFLAEISASRLNKLFCIKIRVGVSGYASENGQNKRRAQNEHEHRKRKKPKPNYGKSFF